MNAIGRSVRPLDWVEKTSGTARYAADQPPAGTLVAKVLRSPHPHARITRLDVSAALKVPGVRAVITQADFVPGRVYEHSGAPYSDRPPLAVDKVLYVGQEVAAVAADTVEAAAAGVRAIKVRYRRLKPNLTVPDALKPGAPHLHERTDGANVALHAIGAWGEVEEAERNSKRRVSGTFYYPRATHVCMEPNTTIAWWHEDRLEMWTSSQAPHFVVHELAALFDLELDQVVCRDVSVGGSFGSKSKISEHEALAARLSMKCGQPVLLELTRAEEFAFTKPRHAFTTKLAAHADADGRMCFLDADIDVDNGAYNHYGPSVMRAGIKQLGSMYRPDAVRWDARLVDTNLTPGGQFRGYGQPQTAIGLETLMDELAEACDVDPIEFRIRNSGLPDTTQLSGSQIGSNRLRECLAAVREKIEWDTRRSSVRAPSDDGLLRGVGVSSGMHASGSYAYPGGNTSACGIDVTDTGDVLVRFGGADAGTGQRTILGQIVAEILGVDFDRVSVIMADWDETPPDMGAWSSRGTHMGGHAARQSAEAMAARLLELGAERLGHADVSLGEGSVKAPGGEVKIGELAAAAAEATDGTLRIDTEYVEPKMQPYWTGIERPNISATYAYAAHAIEVSVDPLTGVIKVLDYAAVHDIGKAINPAMVEGQIVGGALQGLGVALGETLHLEGGQVVNPSYLHYPMPRSTTVPAFDVSLIEGPEPAGPFNAKSVGEIALIPAAPALMNAVYDATGVRFRTLPLSPDVVLAGLQEKAGATPRKHHLARRPSRWQIEAFRRLYPWGIHRVLHRFGTRFARRIAPREITQVLLPETVAEVVSQAAAQRPADVAVIGGGTDLMAQRDQGLKAPLVVIGTSRVASMRRIRAIDDGRIEIGAAVTLAELADWARTRVPILVTAVSTIASAQIRQVATVAGNLGQEKRCWFFRNNFDCYKRGGVSCPCYAIEGDHRLHHAAIGAHRCQAVTPSDLATVFDALDARIRLASPTGTREVSVSDLYAGPGELDLGTGEVIEAVLLPADSAEVIGVFEKLQQTEGDFALVSVALCVRSDAEGHWSSARYTFGGLAARPWSPASLNAGVLGRRPSQAEVTNLLDKELEWEAHPLPGNRWKLDAAVGMAARATGRVLEADHE